MSERANDPYAVWRQANFRLYCVGWFLLVFGKMIETVAVGVHVYDRTDDYLSLGWVGLCQALPVMLLAIAGGQIADRFDRRRVMLVTLSLGTTVSLGLAAAAWWELPVGYIYVLLAVGAVEPRLGHSLPGGDSAADRVVRDLRQRRHLEQHGLPDRLDDRPGRRRPDHRPCGRHRTTGRSTAYAFASGRGLPHPCRSGDLRAAMPIPHPVAQPVSLATLVAGIRYVWRTKLILATITLDLFAVLLGGATYLLPAIARDILHVGAGAWVSCVRRKRSARLRWRCCWRPAADARAAVHRSGR